MATPTVALAPPHGEVDTLVARADGCDDADVPASRDPVDLLVVANDEFARRLRLVGPDDWPRPTPCSEWDVRALVNHVIGGHVRYQLMLHGASTDDVEATRTVDHLGHDALTSFVATADETVACFREEGAFDRIGHHAMGDRTGRELLSMRILDAAVHGWDLARAIGADEVLADEVIDFLLDYTADPAFGSLTSAFAAPGAVDPASTSRQETVLCRLGRRPAAVPPSGKL